MYTSSAHTILFCTVSRVQERAVRTAVTRLDADAFIVVGHGHQASGGVLGGVWREEEMQKS
jgi:uncharacterized membrane-anchored protein YitT (DUF2179 family)